ncbi:hypothetical protein ACW5WN_01275 [Aeromonas lacus]
MILKYCTRTVISEEKDECVSVDELKAHALIVHDMYDQQLLAVIKAAITSIETDTNVSLRQITVQENYIAQAGDVAFLGSGNVQVDYVTVLGTNEQLVKGKHFTVHKNKITFLETVQEVVIQYIAGYKYNNVPPDIRYAVLMRSAALFQTRSDLTSENLKLAARCSDNLVSKYRQLRR